MRVRKKDEKEDNINRSQDPEQYRSGTEKSLSLGTTIPELIPSNSLRKVRILTKV